MWQMLTYPETHNKVKYLFPVGPDSDSIPLMGDDMFTVALCVFVTLLTLDYPHPFV